MSKHRTLVCLVLLAAFCLPLAQGLPAIAAYDEEQVDKTFDWQKEFSGIATVEERVEFLNKRIAEAEKLRMDIKRRIASLNGVYLSGFGEEANLREVGKKVFNDQIGVDEMISQMRGTLKHYQKMVKPEYKEAKAIELKLIALRKELARLRELNEHGRKTGTMHQMDVDTNNRRMSALRNEIMDLRLDQHQSMQKVDAAKEAASKGSEGGGNNCFVAGTLVLMANGTYRPIEDVQIGDSVFTRDVRTGQDMAAEVYKVLRGRETEVYTFDDGLQVNADHRFYTDRGTVMAGNLKPGMVLLGFEGTRKLCSIDKQGVSLATIDKDALPSIPVYNIMVRGTHTFFVSPDGKNTYMVLDISACGQ